MTAFETASALFFAGCALYSVCYVWLYRVTCGWCEHQAPRNTREKLLEIGAFVGLAAMLAGAVACIAML